MAFSTFDSKVHPQDNAGKKINLEMGREKYTN